jgi:amino acid permease
MDKTEEEEKLIFEGSRSHDKKDGLDKSGDTIAFTEEVQEHKVGVIFAGFTVASVAIGAGMVSVPSSMLKSSLSFNLFYYSFNFVMSVFSVHLLLEVKNATGLKSYGE